MSGETAINTTVYWLFIACQATALLYWLLGHLVLSHLPEAWGRIHGGVTALVLIVVPLGWYVVDPPSNGYEEAGRMVAYLASWPLNALGLGTLAWRLHRRGPPTTDNDA